MWLDIVMNLAIRGKCFETDETLIQNTCQNIIIELGKISLLEDYETFYKYKCIIKDDSRHPSLE